MSEPQDKKRGFFGRLFGRGESAPPAAEPHPVQPPADPADDPAPIAEPAAPHSRPDSAATDAGPAASADRDDGAEPDIPPTTAGPTAGATPALVFQTAAAAADPEPAPGPKRSWFQRLKEGLTKTSAKLSEGITGLFTKRKFDASTLDELEDLLIQADLGVETATRITTALAKGRYEKGMAPEDVKAVLAAEVERVLAPVAKPLLVDPARKPHVILVVGVNGTGKTTTIGKLAAQLRRQDKSVLIAAGDTFRAAAIEQLKVWGERTGAPVIARPVGSDASGLAFDALKEAQAEARDVLIIDTAGRLQNKQGLMDELAKIIRVLRKLDPTAPHDVLLVLDATTGQNALSQVEVFRDRAGVTGLVMTKLDGTARGGILVAIAAKHGLPVHAIGVGETVDDLQPFDAKEFARAIAS